MCCSVLQCVAVRVLQYVATEDCKGMYVLQCVLQGVAVRVLQYVAV